MLYLFYSGYSPNPSHIPEFTMSAERLIRRRLLLRASSAWAQASAGQAPELAENLGRMTLDGL